MSRLLHIWSSKEAIGDEKKGKRKGAMELEWATAHFFLSLSHNTTSCIVK